MSDERIRKAFVPLSSKLEIYNEIDKVLDEVKSNIIEDTNKKKKCYQIIEYLDENNFEDTVECLKKTDSLIAVTCAVNVLKARPKGFEIMFKIIPPLFDAVDQDEDKKKRLKEKIIFELPGPVIRLLFEHGWISLDEVMENITITNAYAFADLIDDFYDFAKGFDIENIKLTREWIMSCQIPGSVGHILKTDNVDELIIYRDQHPDETIVKIPTLEVLFFETIFRHNCKFNYYGQLEYAALYGSIRCFKYLLLQDLSVSFYTMSCAIAGGNLEIVRLCLQSGKEFPREDCSLVAAASYRCNLNEWFREVWGNDIDMIFEAKEDDTVPISALSILAHRIYPFIELDQYEINSKNLLDALKHFDDPIGFALKLLDFGLRESFLPLLKLEDEEYFRWAISNLKNSQFEKQPYGRVINSFKPEFLHSLPQNQMKTLYQRTMNPNEIENEEIALEAIRAIIENPLFDREITNKEILDFLGMGFTSVIKELKPYSISGSIKNLKKLSKMRKFIQCYEELDSVMTINIHDPLYHIVIGAVKKKTFSFKIIWYPFSAMAQAIALKNPIDDLVKNFDYYALIPMEILYPKQRKCLLV